MINPPAPPRVKAEINRAGGESTTAALEGMTLLAVTLETELEKIKEAVREALAAGPQWQVASAERRLRELL